MSDIHDRIRRVRLQKGLTLAELAERIGVTEATVQRYESGAIKNIKHCTIQRISDVLDVPPSYLLDVYSESDSIGTQIRDCKFRFKHRLVEAMNLRNLSAAELSRKSGLSKAQISQYVNGIYEAKQDALYKLAKTLNVSEAWLMGHDAPMRHITREEQLCDLVEDLTDEQFEKVMAFVKFIKTEG